MTTVYNRNGIFHQGCILTKPMSHCFRTNNWMTNTEPTHMRSIRWPTVRDVKTDELYPLLFGIIGHCYALIWICFLLEDLSNSFVRLHVQKFWLLQANYREFVIEQNWLPRIFQNTSSPRCHLLNITKCSVERWFVSGSPKILEIERFMRFQGIDRPSANDTGPRITISSIISW